MREPESVPCKVCGKPTQMLADRRCTNCWEVEVRLRTYLKSQNGRKFVIELLAEMEAVQDEQKPMGPTLLCERIGRELGLRADVWFGAMDVANCLARGLCGERLATGQPVSIMVIALGKSRLKATPNRLPAVAAALNRLADTDRVTEAVVRNALVEVMRSSCGVIVVTVSPKGDLSFETANSLAELMKRRAVARVRVQAGTAERRAA